MFKTSRLFAIALLAGTCFAQSPESSKFYKLEFVVKELDGTKVVTARSYSIIVSTEKSAPSSSIRTGSKVPTPGGNSQFNYVDVGVNIDCRTATEVGNDLSLNLTVEMSGTAHETGNVPPVIRQNKWSSMVVVPLRKPTVVFSSADASAHGHTQLELTATPLR